jgi:hypothetical protein
MKDFTRDEAFDEMRKTREVIHKRNLRIARLWWKYFAIQKISKAAKKGKNQVRILAPAGCASEICGILMARKFHYDTYQVGIFLTKVYIGWY